MPVRMVHPPVTGLGDDAFREAVALAQLTRAALAPEVLQVNPSQPRGGVVEPSRAAAAVAEHDASRVDQAGPARHLTAPELPGVTGPPPSTLAEIGDALRRWDASRPRTVQTTLGPSELGTPCDRQIAMKLAGVQQRDRGLAWAPLCGTAVHGLMEDVLRAENERLGRERWIIEQKVQLDDELSGHGDAFDTDWAMVVDWKYTGTTARRKAARKSVPNAELVSPEYRTQAHLYGLGHRNAGRDVRFVRLVLLARSHDYSESVEWTEEYREDIALDAMTRFYAIRDKVLELDAARLPERLSWIPATAGDACKWCPFRRPTPPGGMAVDATGCEGDTGKYSDAESFMK